MIDNNVIGIIGLGYVGLPLAIEFSKKYRTIGFDIKVERIKNLLKGFDETLEIDSNTLMNNLVQGPKSKSKNVGLILSSDLHSLKECNFYIITVPTPIDKNNHPDLSPILSATKLVGSILKKGDIVIYESTVYPGVTEDECVPILEKLSSLVFNKDFFCGYSPERINPGDKEHTISKILKITSGSTKVSANKIDKLYKSIITAGTYQAPSIKIAEAAKVRGTGIAKRKPAYIATKMENGNAVIALDDGKFAGFCYIEKWGHGKFVANSGLIVHPNYRNIGLAKQIKQVIFKHSRTKFPKAKIFSITTGLPVMKLNSDLGYKPVTFSELTDDQSFWDGCQTCRNFDVLTRTDRKMCLCTGMLFDPKNNNKEASEEVKESVFKKLKNIKQNLFLKKDKK